MKFFPLINPHLTSSAGLRRLNSSNQDLICTSRRLNADDIRFRQLKTSRSDKHQGIYSTPFQFNPNHIFVVFEEGQLIFFPFLKNVILIYCVFYSLVSSINVFLGVILLKKCLKTSFIEWSQYLGKFTAREWAYNALSSLHSSKVFISFPLNHYRGGCVYFTIQYL